MQYTPKTKKELDESQLVPHGDWDIECYDAEDTKSKKTGKEMFKLSLKVFIGDAQRFYTDYIVPSSDMGLTKLYSFCEATGQLDKYESGDMEADDFIGKCCKAVIHQKPDKETKELRNDLRKYITLAEAEERAKAASEKKSKVPVSAQPDPEDDVPF